MQLLLFEIDDNEDVGIADDALYHESKRRFFKRLDRAEAAQKQQHPHKYWEGILESKSAFGPPWCFRYIHELDDFVRQVVS